MVWTQGTGSTAVAAQGSGWATAYMRNVTAIATGPESAGATSRFQEVMSSGSQTLDIANSIVSGSEIDLRGSGEGEHGNIVVSHSNFRTRKGDEGSTVTSKGGNQTDQPLFVDAASGNFEEAAGSPTIDTGAIDNLIGATDLAGNPRVIGNTVDIGAYEFMPPPPAPPSGGSTGAGTTAPPPPAPPNVPGTLTLSAKKLTVDSKGHLSVPFDLLAGGRMHRDAGAGLEDWQGAGPRRRQEEEARRRPREAHLLARRRDEEDHRPHPQGQDPRRSAGQGRAVRAPRDPAHLRQGTAERRHGAPRQVAFGASGRRKRCAMPRKPQ